MFVVATGRSVRVKSRISPMADDVRMGVLTENKIVGQSPSADGCAEGIEVVFSDGLAVGAGGVAEGVSDGLAVGAGGVAEGVSEGLAVVGERVGGTEEVGTRVGENGEGANTVVNEDGVEDKLEVGVEVASPQYM